MVTDGKRDLNSLKYYHLQIINKNSAAPALRIHLHQWTPGKRCPASFEMKPIWTLKTVQRTEEKHMESENTKQNVASEISRHRAHKHKHTEKKERS